MTAQTRRPGRLLAAVGAGALVVGALVATPAAAVNPAGIVSLDGSNFEIDSDANLRVDNSGWTDWVSFAHASSNDPEKRKADKPTGSGDDSFGQGAKEDTVVPSVVDGSIPPNKSDLKTFGLYLEKTAGDDFLHMFWHRVQDPSGTTNMDFEFNKSKTASSNGVTPVRTEGDMLIQYDLSQGGTNPNLFLARWLTDTNFAGVTVSTADCVASNSFPCWGKRVDLSAAGDATGSINTSAIPADQSDGLGTVSPRTFGEATVNFTKIAGTGCSPFGSAYLKSRSSDSFTAAMKDFIAPIDTGLDNCGTVTIIKKTAPRGLNQSFSFTSTLAGSEMSCTSDTTPAAFTLNDNGNSTANSTGNTETCTNVPAGSYTVEEGADPAGFAFGSLTCTASGAGTSATAGTGATEKVASITMAGGGSVTCTYVNNQQLGAIKITKNDSKGTPTPLAGAKFSITKGGSAITGSPFTTDSNGQICVDNLLFGDYVVTETQAPTGYQIDDTAGHTVSVDNNTSCGSSFTGETITFTDTPLSKIQVQFTSLAGTDVTKASIVCAKGGVTVAPQSENGSADPAYDDTDETITNLTPGVYTCTVDVDP